MVQNIGTEGPKIPSDIGSYFLGGAQDVDNVDDDVGGAKFSPIPKSVATVFAASAHCCIHTPSLLGPERTANGDSNVSGHFASSLKIECQARKIGTEGPENASDIGSYVPGGAGGACEGYRPEN